ncbi:hypothetical protein V1264_011179 [Littorina saxatilis]|uniref:Ig-like domain-containing protein n=2 Tax=Littorina saxatilis TaxID=31220 RepID=A0AAN9BUK1_9CAEN
MLSFSPPSLVLSEDKPHEDKLFIRCQHPTRDDVETFHILRIGRRSLEDGDFGNYECVVSSEDTCTDIHTCPKDTSICSPSPMTSIQNSSVSVSGSYAKSLTVTITNASCGAALFRYRCYSALVKQGEPAVEHSEQYGKLLVTLDTRRPTLTIELLTDTSERNTDALSYGTRLILTCRAAISLTTTTTKPKWVWEGSDGSVGAWTKLAFDSTVREPQGCVVISSASHTATLASGQTCTRRFRCYVEGHSDLAAKHTLVVLDCGKVSIGAIVVAVVGTLVFIIGIVFLSVALLLRKKALTHMDTHDKILKTFDPNKGQETQVVDRRHSSPHAGQNDTMSGTSRRPSVLLQISDGGPNQQWPLTADQYQKKWSPTDFRDTRVN